MLKFFGSVATLALDAIEAAVNAVAAEKRPFADIAHLPRREAPADSSGTIPRAKSPRSRPSASPSRTSMSTLMSCRPTNASPTPPRDGSLGRFGLVRRDAERHQQIPLARRTLLFLDWHVVSVRLKFLVPVRHEQGDVAQVGAEAARVGESGVEGEAE